MSFLSAFAHFATLSSFFPRALDFSLAKMSAQWLPHSGTLSFMPKYPFVVSLIWRKSPGQVGMPLWALHREWSWRIYFHKWWGKWPSLKMPLERAVKCEDTFKIFANLPYCFSLCCWNKCKLLNREKERKLFIFRSDVDWTRRQQRWKGSEIHSVMHMGTSWMCNG